MNLDKELVHILAVLLKVVLVVSEDCNGTCIRRRPLAENKCVLMTNRTIDLKQLMDLPLDLYCPAVCLSTKNCTAVAVTKDKDLETKGRQCWLAAPGDKQCVCDTEYDLYDIPPCSDKKKVMTWEECFPPTTTSAPMETTTELNCDLDNSLYLEVDDFLGACIGAPNTMYNYQYYGVHLCSTRHQTDMRLIEVSDAEGLKYVSEKFGDSMYQVWLGAKVVNGSLLWVSTNKTVGNDLDGLWAPGEPKPNSDECVLINTDGELMRSSCDQVGRFACVHDSDL